MNLGAISITPPNKVTESPLRILTDDVERKPIMNFEGFSESIAKMVKASHPKFSIGIYGEWGTGKTTLMQLIEDKLKNDPGKNDLFIWDNIPNNDSSDSAGLKSFLRDNYKQGWLEDPECSFVTEDKKTLSIYSKGYTQKFLSKGTYDQIPEHSLSIKLNDRNTLATLIIEGEEVGEFIVQEREGKMFLKTIQILPVWFNAWRYEREEKFALIALMKTIAYAMGDLPTYRNVRNVFLRGLEVIGKDVLRHFALEYAMTEKGFDEIEKVVFPKVELLSKVDKETIYFEGMKKIEEEMRKIARTNRRIVIFIDDLDRCEAKKALEVFESTKIFLDMEGFVFIIGLSYAALSKLISVKYQPLGVRGDEYIRKIIQVYVNLPKWKEPDIKELIKILSSRLGNGYIKLFQGKEQLIATAAGLNPREVKRLLNRFVVTHSIDPDMNIEEYLVRYALEAQWNDVYTLMDENEDFRNHVKEWATYDKSEREHRIATRKNEGKPLDPIEEKLFGIPSALWEFLDKYKHILPSVIEGWKMSQESFESSIDPLSKVSQPDFKVDEEEQKVVVAEYKKMIFDASEVSKTIERFQERTEPIRKQVKEEVSRGMLNSKAEAEIDRYILQLRNKF